MNPLAARTEPVSSARWQRLRQVTPVRLLRQSLSVQVAAGMGIVVIIVLAVLFLTVSSLIRVNVYEQRLQQVLEDASIRISQAQSTFDQSTAATPDQVQELANQVISSLQASSSSAGAVSTMLLRSPSASTTFAINDLVDRDHIGVLSSQLRARTASGEGQYYQAVELASSPGGTAPGIAVSALVSLPQAGDYELYIIYSLQKEQATVAMIFASLAIGAIPVVVVLGMGVLYVTYRLLRPVRTTAVAARKLAEGDLSVRVDARGDNEMAHLANAFNDMAQSLQDTIARYDELSLLEQRFVSDVSHELRTPLTTIRMAEDVIYDARESFDPVTGRSAELLHEQVDRLDSMLADLLEISRYDANSAALEVDEVNFGDLAQKVAKVAAPLAQRNGVELVVQAPTERCVADADARRMERVLRNLVVNAIEHAEGKPVQITVATSGTSTAVRVRDWGVGMSEHTRNHVFERFFRADPARARTTGGTGLGLSIAYEDVALHQGTLQVWGELGRGSAFLLHLPRRLGGQLGMPPIQLWSDDEPCEVDGAGGVHPAQLPRIPAGDSEDTEPEGAVAVAQKRSTSYRRTEQVGTSFNDDTRAPSAASPESKSLGE